MTHTLKHVPFVFLSIERAKKLVPQNLLKDGIGSNREWNYDARSSPS